MSLSGKLQAAALVCAASGCLRDPVFTYRDAASGGGDGSDAADPDAMVAPPFETVVAMTGGADDLLVVGEHFEMKFSGGFGLPVSVLLDGMEMIGRGQKCNDEQGLGMAIYPPIEVNGFNSFGLIGMPAQTVRLQGPGIVQIRVNATAGTTCNNAASTHTFTSTYTVFPDGRVTRYEAINHGAVSSQTCTICTDGGGGDGGVIYLTSYTTLAADNSTLSSDFSAPGDNYDESAPAGSSVCLDRQGNQIALAWDGPRSHRIRTVAAQPPNAYAFIEDITTGSSLGSGLANATTTMLLRNGDDCSAMRALAGSYYDVTRNLLITTKDGDLQLAPSVDGIYGNGAADGTSVFDPPVGAFTIRANTVAIPGYWALRMHLGSQPSGLTTVLHSTAWKSDGFRLQRIDPAFGTNDFVIVFRDALEPGETITVTPQ